MIDSVDKVPSGRHHPAGGDGEDVGQRFGSLVEVLLVDESPHEAALVRSALEQRAGCYRLSTVDNLAEASQRIFGDEARQRPDLVIFDWELVADDSRGLLAEGGGERPCAAIVMTSRGDERVAVEAMRRGALDYVVKTPAGLAELPRLVDRALREWGHILDLRRAEEALAERELHFRQLVEQSQDVVTILGGDGRIHYQSPSIERVLGYGQSELVGHRVLELVHRDDREMAMRAVRRALESDDGSWRLQCRFRHQDGSWRTLESVGRAQQGSGSSERTIISARDVSERVEAEAERAKLEAQLHHAQKLETIGTLAGGIAHDFNNILTSLYGFAGLVLEGLPADSPVLEDVGHVLRAATRAKELVRRILTFSRQVEPERRPVAIVDVVREALTLVRASLPSTITIHSRLDPAAGTVEADPSQLHQVLLNLSANAAHAMRQSGGILEVEVAPDILDERGASLVPGLEAGGYVRVRVSDTGHGMDAATRERIFEPFFTTKATNEGTGLGLAVVHGIVASHGGAIRAESEIGEGSVFTLWLPASRREALSDDILVPLPLKGTERILYVDDEPDIVIPMRRLFEMAGYRIEVTTSPLRALELVEREPSAFDLVVTDRTMPGMGGPELADALHTVRRELPIILVSGYGTSAEDLVGPRFRAALGKPFTFQDLASAIRQTLSEL